MTPLGLPVDDQDRHVLEFDCGVRAYPPTESGGYWRLRWSEGGTRRDTSASSRAVAVSKAAGLVERLAQGTRTDLARAKGSALVAHYLDTARRPPRGAPWSERHREEQQSYCARFVVPVLGPLECARLGRTDFQKVLDRAPTASVAAHLRRCLSALVSAGLEEGYLLVRQDVLRGVRWHPPEGTAMDQVGEFARSVSQAEIPTASDVAAHARAAAHITGVWWRELEILVVAYSGLRWGEHAALTADRIDVARRRIIVDRQVIETRHCLKLSAPKGRKQRVTMYPARTPAGANLAEMLLRRLREIGPRDLVFPSPRGKWARRSGYARRVFHPAAQAAGWPRQADGRWAWTFHSLRHVFATWALAQPGARLEDVSRLLGHSSVRITQDIYVSPDGDLFERFYAATE